ncbi:hypothetical protein E4U45_008497 [Claviceps purpurea]|nr:hypothetical protein E4U45_008497 [Claviceps purpurea]
MASSRFMEEFLNRPARMTGHVIQSLTLSPCLQLSSPPPPTASEKGKGKVKAAKLIGDVYDVYLGARPAFDRFLRTEA